MDTCDHAFCRTRVMNHDKGREEERDCTGTLTRIRLVGRAIWLPAEIIQDPAPRPEPAPGTIRVTNDQGGVKADGGKMQPRLLMQSMPNAVKEICEVLTYGANKYTPDNWKKVEDDRYTDALYRHLLAFHAGEQVDSETKKHHLAHAACCILFLLEKQNA